MASTPTRPRGRIPATPSWHVIARPVPANWHGQAVLQLMFNPNTLTVTAADLQTADQAMTDLVAGTPGRQEAELTTVPENQGNWSTPHQSITLVITETARTTKRARYHGPLKGQENALVTAQQFQGARHGVLGDNGTYDVEDDTRQHMSIVRCDPSEPDPDIRMVAYNTMEELAKASAATLAATVITPTRWDPRYEHTNPDSDGWQEILRWCTATFPTRAAAQPWMDAGFEPLAAVDYAVNGFTPATAQPWLAAFPMDGHAADAWATAGTPVDLAAAWSETVRANRDWEAEISPDRDRAWGTLTEQVRLQQRGIPPDVYARFEEVPPEEIVDWFNQLGVERGCAYSRAGYHLQEALELDQDPATRPDLDALLVEGVLHNLNKPAPEPWSP